jgi:hypothetical protein
MRVSLIPLESGLPLCLCPCVLCLDGASRTWTSAELDAPRLAAVEELVSSSRSVTLRVGSELDDGRRELPTPVHRATLPSSSNAHVIPDIRDSIASPVPRLRCHEPRYGSTVTLATLEPAADTPRGRPPRPNLVRRWTADDGGLPSVICGLAGGVMSRVDKGPHPAARSMRFIRILPGDMGALQHRDELETSSRNRDGGSTEGESNDQSMATSIRNLDPASQSWLPIFVMLSTVPSTAPRTLPRPASMAVRGPRIRDPRFEGMSPGSLCHLPTSQNSTPRLDASSMGIISTDGREVGAMTI